MLCLGAEIGSSPWELLLFKRARRLILLVLVHKKMKATLEERSEHNAIMIERLPIAHTVTARPDTVTLLCRL